MILKDKNQQISLHNRERLPQDSKNIRMIKIIVEI